MLGKPFQYIVAQWVVDTGGELAVGKGARSPLTELDIAGGIQSSRRPEAFHFFNPPVYIAATLHYNGAVSLPCQQLCRKHTGRAKARYNHRSSERFDPFFHHKRDGLLKLSVPARFFCRLLLVLAQMDNYGAHLENMSPFPGIHRSFSHISIFYFRHTDPQLTASCRHRLRFRLAQRRLHIANEYHKIIHSAASHRHQ